jgi:signal transduction histidine kinase/ActR/RegA family two-component response regulator
LSEREELERLRRENAALDQQIKLLVQTEQRLYHSQNELDQQLLRIRSLGEFALHSSSLESPDEVLHRAVELVRTSFYLDGCCAVRPDPASAELAGLSSWVGDRGAALITDESQLPELLRSRLEGPIDVVVALPLRTAPHRLLGVLLAWKERGTRASYHDQVLADQHLPFLGLLANHVERALHNTLLAGDLTQSNEQLTASLEKLERTQQELLQARKMEAVGRLAGGIAHDFNNLLTVIINHAELLRSGLGADAPGLVDVDRISQASERAANITRQLLAFSRKEPRQPEVLDLNEVTDDTASMLEELIGEKIVLELHLAPSLGKVRADRSQLEQVLLNLVVNARDAMPGGGRVEIATRDATVDDARGADEAFVSSDFIALSIADNGGGMDAETRAQVFEPFFTTKGVGQGTGLGLSMVYGAVQQNYGQIKVDSEPGRGSTFTVLLPRAPGPYVADGVSAPTLEESGATILMAEDEESVRHVAACILEHYGHRVIEAASGEAALALGLGGPDPIDVLVTDIVMPGLGGVELARKLREARPELPVVYVSGYPFERLDLDALAANEEFLQKPFTGETLSAKVAQVRAAAAAQRPVHG